MGIQYAYAADIVKTERDEDTGDLIVYGKATGPDLDLDEQICDAEWLKTAMPAWFEWGNVREMHQPIAAGVGIELEEQGDDWYVKSRCVDPSTAAKIEAGVLKGYSVGIKNPKVIKDAAAPGGRINGGSVVELSYVDRPCNPTAKMAIAKAVGADPKLRPVEADAAETVEVTIKVAGSEFKPSDLAKILGGRTATKSAPEASGDTADETPDNTEAPAVDATSPSEAEQDIDVTDTTKSVKDVLDALRAVGRTKDLDATKSFIKQRVKALGLTDLAPEDSKAAGTDVAKAESDAVHDANELATIRSGLIRLIHAELDELENGEPEMWDIEGLLCSLRQFLNWWEDEAWTGETESPRETPKPGGTDVAPDNDATDADEATDADTTKASATEESEEDTPDEGADTTSGSAKSAEPDKDLLTELVKSAVADATKPLIEKAAEERKALEAELKTVKDDLAKALALPEPGGPVLSRTAAQAATTKAAAAEKVKADANALIAKADQMQSTDRYTAQGYRDRANALLKSIEA